MISRRLLVHKVMELVCASRTFQSKPFNGCEHQNLVWVDLEMSGLNLESDVIMEIGCLVTDKDLNHLDEGIEVVIHQPESILENMNDWCKIHHAQSGLTERCRISRVTVEEAESNILNYVSKHVVSNLCPLAGNTVHEDRRFLLKYMPRLVDYMHYRIVDVSTVKELCRRWYPVEYEKRPQKAFAHRSMDDIKESIEELKYYWNNIFRQSGL